MQFLSERFYFGSHRFHKSLIRDGKEDNDRSEWYKNGGGKKNKEKKKFGGKPVLYGLIPTK